MIDGYVFPGVFNWQTWDASKCHVGAYFAKWLHRVKFIFGSTCSRGNSEHEFPLGDASSE